MPMSKRWGKKLNVNATKSYDLTELGMGKQILTIGHDYQQLEFINNYVAGKDLSASIWHRCYLRSLCGLRH